jgi:hypothetical protein
VLEKFSRGVYAFMLRAHRFLYQHVFDLGNQTEIAEFDASAKVLPMTNYRRKSSRIQPRPARIILHNSFIKIFTATAKWWHKMDIARNAEQFFNFFCNAILINCSVSYLCAIKWCIQPRIVACENRVNSMPCASIFTNFKGDIYSRFVEN